MTEILGSGLAFPLAGRPPRRPRARRATRQDIEQAIELILGTAPGERPMRPEFGCGVHDFVFDTIDADTVGAHRGRDPRRRSTAGSRGSRSPSVDFDLVARRRRAAADRHRLPVRATNDERNLVYPFYVIPAEETE